MLFCLCMEKNGNSLNFSVLCFFYRVASINSVQATALQSFYSSRLVGQLVFDNLSKNLIVCPQDLDVLIISIRPFTIVHTVIEI